MLGGLVEKLQNLGQEEKIKIEQVGVGILYSSSEHMAAFRAANKLMHS
jgi:hypothetical protein